MLACNGDSQAYEDGSLLDEVRVLATFGRLSDKCCTEPEQTLTE